jgi:hypothetical protein
MESKGMRKKLSAYSLSKLLKNFGSGFKANHIFSGNNAGGVKRQKNLRFFSGAHRSVSRKNILSGEKPLFQQPVRKISSWIQMETSWQRFFHCDGKYFANE